MTKLAHRLLAALVAVCVGSSPVSAQVVGAAGRAAGVSSAAGASVNISLPSVGTAGIYSSPSLLPSSVLPLGAVPSPFSAVSAAATPISAVVPAAHAVVPLAKSVSVSVVRPVAVSVSAAAAESKNEFRPGTSLPEAVLEHARVRGFAFDAKSESLGAESLPRALSAASETNAPDAPQPPSPKPAKSSKAWPAAIWTILGILTLGTIGVESLGLAVPQYAREYFGYGTMATLSAAASISLSIGSLIGGQASDKFGAERTYIASLAGRAVLIGALAVLHATGGLTAPLLVGLFAADYVLHYANYVALDTLAPRRLGADPVKLNRFGLARQVVIDGIGFGGPILAGLVIASVGYGPVFWAYPALFAVSAIAGFLSLRGKVGDAPTMRLAPKPKNTAKWSAVMREMLSSPPLRMAVAGFAIINVASMSLYFMLGPAFGGAAAAASGGSAAQITSVMTGLFAGGGLLGAWVMSRLTGRIEKDASTSPEAERAARTTKALLRAMGGVAALFGATLLGFWSMLGTAPLFTLTIAGTAYPLFLSQFLMIPFGAALAVVFVGLLTIVQSMASEPAKAKAAGLMRSTAMLLSFGFSYVLGEIFSRFSTDGTPGAAAFGLVAGVMTALAVASGLIGWRLFRAGRK